MSVKDVNKAADDFLKLKTGDKLIAAAAMLEQDTDLALAMAQRAVQEIQLSVLLGKPSAARKGRA